MGQTINKPQKKIVTHPASETCYDYHECIEFLEKKHNVKFRDWAKSEKHFNSWCDSKGYGKKDSSGKSRSASTIWFAKYNKDSKGYKSRPPYQDFWRVLLSLYDISNGKTVNINFLKDEPKLKEQWEQEAYKMIHEEFADKNGDILFYMSW